MASDRSRPPAAVRGRVPLRVAFRGPALPRCQLAQAVSRSVQAALLIALSVHLFDRGGASLLAVYGVVRTVVPALANPVVATVLGRARPGRALAAAFGTSAVTTVALAALVASSGPVVAILVVDALGGVLVGAARPLVTSLLPRYLRGPQELVATNAASAMVESISVAVGPLVAGVALGVVGSVPVVTGAAALLGAAAVAVAGLPDAAGHRTGAQRLVHEVVAGATAVLRDGDVRVLLALVGAQAFVRGATNVFVVGLAIDRLGIGESGVGLLLGAIGVGGLVVLPVASRLLAPGRSARLLGIGVVLWGVPVALAAATVSDLVVVVLFAVVGVGNTVVDVSIDTLLQRLIPSGTLPPALGFYEAALFGAMGGGSLVTGVLLGVTSLPTVLVLVGSVPVLIAAVTARRLVRLDRSMTHRDTGIAVLQLNVVLSPLVLTAIDQLATRTRATSYEPGDAIITQGDVGDRFHVVESGLVEVTRDGHHIASLGPGDCFGEMALLDDAPRNATVTAGSEVTTRSIGRDDFLATIGADERARGAARRLADERRPDPD